MTFAAKTRKPTAPAPAAPLRRAAKDPQGSSRLRPAHGAPVATLDPHRGTAGRPGPNAFHLSVSLPGTPVRRHARREGAGTEAASSRAPAAVHDVLGAPGTPLDAGTRSWMEPRFGRSFGDVVVHTDVPAAESAEAVGAHAYAVGSHLVFGAGRYRPGEAAGRRLIAHELAHVVQQRGAGSAGLQSRLEVGPVDAPEEREADAAADAVVRGEGVAVPPGGPVSLRREPGVVAQESWDALAAYDAVPDDEAALARGGEAVSRFLRMEEGARLINQIWHLLCTAEGCRSRIVVHFADALPPGHDAATGHFSPAAPRAREYVIHIRNARPSSIRGARTLSTEWPTEGPPLVRSTAGDPESRMGEALFHELLHVWFVNARRGATFPTGHGAAAEGEVEQEFVDRLRIAAEQMVEVERLVRSDAEAQRRELEERRPEEAPRRPTPPTPPVPDAPSPVGFATGLQVGGGGFAGGEGQFHTVLGADLILRDLAGLRLGARGIYMTPDHLLLGPSVGFRILEPGSRVERPFYFDIEAGALFELGPPAARRVSDVVSGFAGIGVGQEFGREGPRAWWRIGGMLIVTDRPAAGGEPVTVGGSGMAGAGVSF